MRIVLITLILAFSLLACSWDAKESPQVNDGIPQEDGSDTQQEESDTQQEAALAWNCEDPRPTRCGNEDEPVCGNDGSEYRNYCYACRNTAVLTYTEGLCAKEMNT